MYKSIFGFSTKLTSSLPADSAFFPISNLVRKRLLELLDAGDYTHIMLSDGNAREIVRLENYCNTLILYRGRSTTRALPFPCGATATYLITSHTVESIVCAIDNCEDNLMPYVAAIDFSVNTVVKLADIDTDIPIADDKLAILLSKIPEGAHTYLSIYDGTNTEVVKASNVYGKISLERGQELTESHTFPIGSVIEHVMTPTAIREIVCQMDCCP